MDIGRIVTAVVVVTGAFCTGFAAGECLYAFFAFGTFVPLTLAIPVEDIPATI